MVHPIEPGTTASERLRENVELTRLGQVRIHRVVVADRSGPVHFTQVHDSANRIVGADVAPNTAARLRAATLDELVGETRFAMGKMDIEGAEPLALRGADTMLDAANPPVWQIEFNRIALQRFGYDRPELASLLAQRGFDLARYHPDERRLEFHPGAWEGRRDVLAVARSRRDEVLERLGA
jgi:FkbM family methyltransferase